MCISTRIGNRCVIALVWRTTLKELCRELPLKEKEIPSINAGQKFILRNSIFLHLRELPKWLVQPVCVRVWILIQVSLALRLIHCPLHYIVSSFIILKKMTLLHIWILEFLAKGKVGGLLNRISVFWSQRKTCPWILLQIVNSFVTLGRYLNLYLPHLTVKWEW